MSAKNDLLTLLRSRPNPFADLVAPQHDDHDTFGDTYSPHIHADARQTLLATIDSYRLDQYQGQSDLNPSRAVTIVGPRGAGKTQLLRSLVLRQDRKPQLFVCRESDDYDPSTPFDEYIYHQLIRTLSRRDPIRGRPPFDELAIHLTSLLLRQTIRELTVTDRLFFVEPTFGQTAWSVLRGKCRDPSERYFELNRRLEDPREADQLANLARRYDFDPEALADLVLARLERLETHQEGHCVVRSELYQAMVRRSLLEIPDAFQDFLEADYQPAAPFPMSRGEIVRNLLHSLVEACALVKLPVVLAFDNMEGLLAPTGDLTNAQTRAGELLSGMAQFVDNVRGFLILIFIEQYLYQNVRKTAPSFALSRLDQGVKVPGLPTVGRLDLRAPNAQDLRSLIEDRMRALAQ